VKEVVNGDTVVVVAAVQGPAVPPEKRLTLSSLIAPRLVSCTLQLLAWTCVQLFMNNNIYAICRASVMAPLGMSHLPGTQESFCGRS
jgi:hypothetical protein